MAKKHVLHEGPRHGEEVKPTMAQSMKGVIKVENGKYVKSRGVFRDGATRWGWKPDNEGR